MKNLCKFLLFCICNWFCFVDIRYVCYSAFQALMLWMKRCRRSWRWLRRHRIFRRCMRQVHPDAGVWKTSFPMLVIEISSWKVVTGLREINLSRPPSHLRIWPLPKPSTLKRRSQPWSSIVHQAVSNEDVNDVKPERNLNITHANIFTTSSKIVKTCSWTALRAIHRSSTIVFWTEKSHQISQQRRQALWSPNESWCWCCVVRDDCGRCSQLFGVFGQQRKSIPL